MGTVKEKNNLKVISVRATQEEWDALERILAERNGGRRESQAADPSHTDDPDIWIRVSAHSATDAADDPSDSLATISNIGERKRMQEEIEVMHTNLASRACELEMANHELAAFSDTVSHDLRLPITIINGYCQLILETAADHLGEECKGYIRLIYDESIKASQLIDTLLDFSRLGHTAMRYETVDLGEMAREIVAELKLAQPQRRVEYRGADGVLVRGDADLLRIALGNLLGNAWKYTATQEETLIEFGAVDHGGTSAYYVRDNGVGFDMIHAHKLFKAFQRLHSRKEFEGVGIGLSIVQKIVQRHGGEVWTEADVGRGATFYFSLNALKNDSR